MIPLLNLKPKLWSKSMPKTSSALTNQWYFREKALTCEIAYRKLCLMDTFIEKLPYSICFYRKNHLEASEDVRLQSRPRYTTSIIKVWKCSYSSSTTWTSDKGSLKRSLEYKLGDCLNLIISVATMYKIECFQNLKEQYTSCRDELNIIIIFWEWVRCPEEI